MVQINTYGNTVFCRTNPEQEKSGTDKLSTSGVYWEISLSWVLKYILEIC